MELEELLQSRDESSPALLTPAELAARLRVPKSWVYTRTRERGPGRIPVIEVGRHLRFIFPEVLQWLEARGRRDRG